MNMTAQFSLDNINVDTLVKALEGFPKDAKVSVVVHHGDRWMMDKYSLKVSWTK